MAEATMPILEMKNVGKISAQNGRAIEALRGANLRVKKGEFICLIGASGCGKSTLLRHGRGLRGRDQGDNLMWGVPITGPGPEPRHGVSGLRPVSLAQRPRQYRLRPEIARPAARPRSAKPSIASSTSSACSASPTSIRTSSPAA